MRISDWSSDVCSSDLSDYLLSGAITNSINVPSISAEEAPKLTPYAVLAQQLGSFAGQLTEDGIEEVTLEYEGDVANMNTRVLTDRKSVVEGKSVSVRVDIGGRRIIKKKT